MNQKKIGSFLKELRKEKDITQEQLAEKLLPLHRQNRLTFLFYPTISLIKGDGF